MNPPRRIAVVGHVEHVTLGRVPAFPRPGDIVHLRDVVVFPGGGGGVAFFQLVKGPDRLHLFTAFGDDDGGEWVRARVRETGAEIHAATRAAPHPRVVVAVTPDGERTILVTGGPHHPQASDALDWGVLGRCDAVFFTADDPGILRLARAAPLLVVVARRREALVRSSVRADVVVGSHADPLEAASFADYPVRPGALVLTRGEEGGTIETEAGLERFPAPPSPGRVESAYGAGDSFAAALVHYLAAGLPILEACTRAGPHGAAVLRGPDPLSAQIPLR